MCVCEHTCACWGWSMEGHQKLTLSMFPSHSPPYFLIQGLSLNLELADLARLAGQGAPSACVSPVLGLWRSAAVSGLCCGVLGNEVRSSHMHSQSLPDSHLHSPACVYEIAVFHSPSPRFYHKSKNLYETALILFSLANRTPSDLTHFQCAKRSLHFQLSSFPPLVSQHCFN